MLFHDIKKKSFSFFSLKKAIGIYSSISLLVTLLACAD